MNKNTITIALMTFILGAGLGYTISTSTSQGTNKTLSVNTQNHGMHTMPDGSMMSNNEETMNMADIMSSMNKELQGKTGDAFDKAFITEMIVHHQGAVEMAQLALTNAKRREIKDLAQAIITAQNKEISSMKNWSRDWYNQ